MGVIKFDRDFETLFNWDTDENPTTEQDYQNAVKNWTETEMNIVDTLLWQPTTEYATGNIVKTPSLPSQYVLRCTEAGTSGSTEPDYSGAGVGDTVTDGTVEWVIVSLATGNAADVDASNIGVNAEVDNSETWGNAIGGGAIAEDDGRLVTGDTVYAVTSELASDIATNTEAIEDNTEAIATNTETIAQHTTDIDIAEKKISNIEKLLQGNLYDYQTDTDSAYTKTVPAGAMPYASLDSIGGKTLVFNQLVDYTTMPADYNTVGYDCRIVNNNDGSFTFTNGAGGTAPGTPWYLAKNLVIGHKYCLIGWTNPAGLQVYPNGTPVVSSDSIFTLANHDYLYLRTAGATWQAGDTFTIKPKLADLTLMFGAGNEPSTLDEFLAIYPNFGNEDYNAGQLISAGVTSVISKGYNHINETYLQSQWTYSSGVYSGSPLTMLNNYNSAINQTWKPNTAYTLSADVGFFEGNNVKLKWSVYYTDGTSETSNEVSERNAFETMSITTNPAKTIDYVRWTLFNGYSGKYKNLVIHDVVSTTPIPAEIQALEGYGWSAGSVYNYIDYEAKKFVQNVGSVDLGTLTYTYRTDTTMPIFQGGISGIGAKRPLGANTPANIVSPLYVTVSSNNVSQSGYDKGIAISADAIRIYIQDSAYTNATTFTSAMNGVYLYYELATPQEIDISAYLTDDNLIEVEAGGSLTFPNSNGTDYQIPVPSAETYMVDLQSAI